MTYSKINRIMLTIAAVIVSALVMYALVASVHLIFTYSDLLWEERINQLSRIALTITLISSFFVAAKAIDDEAQFDNETQLD